MLAAGGLCVGLGRLGGDAVDAARARTAADAAALAGAADGQGAGREVADGQRRRLVAYVDDGAEVVVTVRVGRAVATARAVAAGEGAGRRPPGRRAGAGAGGGAAPRPGEVLGRRPDLVRLAVAGPAAGAVGRPGTNPFPVARPGTSAHERGEAVDVPRRSRTGWPQVGPRVGLCRPLPATDPVHFELCRPRQ